MATAPSRRAAVVATSVTGTNPTSATVTISAGNTVVGDLIVVMWTGTGALGSALSVPTCSYATFTQDATADDGTRNAYVWSGVCTTSPGGAAVTITLTLPTNSGTRRLMAFTVNPGSGQHWDAGRKVRTLTGTGTAGGNPWTASWGASTSNTNPEFPVMAYAATSTSTQTLDWGDGNGAVSDSYPNTSAVQHVWALSSTVSAGYSTNTLASTSTVSFGSQAATNKAYVGVLYAVADPIQARAKTASKAAAAFTVIRHAQGRGNTANKATGLGTRYTGVRTSSGRGNSASSATGRLRPKTAGGVARTAADSSTSDWGRVAPSAGRGRAASKATGAGRVFHSNPARGRTAGQASARFTILRVANGRGPTAAAAPTRYSVWHRSSGLAPTAGTGTGHAIRLVHRSGLSGTAGAGRGYFLVHGPPRYINLDGVATVDLAPATTTVSLAATATVVLDGTATVVLTAPSIVSIPEE